ncbi:MAG TPA: hypothetical protein VFK35_10245 [Candidatus Limnocylindrales bacterium]|nr:hypothetical protein [Candidatus Limnocylindrales bacterium]
MPGPTPTPLDPAALERATAWLVARDADLAGIVERHGPSPLWARPPGFASLAAIVLEQQVSLRSGAAALERLGAAAGGIEPVAVAALGEDGARRAGLTRQKARYVTELARAIADGRFDLDAVAAVEDEEARASLLTLVGVGRWTADIYLLMALGRPDVWPSGDLALGAALAHAKRLAVWPDDVTQRSIADAWRPWRSVAARILWHAYLAGER